MGHPEQLLLLIVAIGPAGLLSHESRRLHVRLGPQTFRTEVLLNSHAYILGESRLAHARKTDRYEKEFLD